MRPNIVLILAALFALIVVLVAIDKRTRFPPAPPPQAVKAPTVRPAQGVNATAAAVQPAQPAVGEHSDTVESLPDGPGREETFYACAACHGTLIIKQQGMSRELWAASIDFMIEKHGMAKPNDSDRAKILDYLTTQFPPRAQRPGRGNPFLRGQ